MRSRGADGRESHYWEPQLLGFNASAPEQGLASIRPRWDRDYQFTEHSYRGIAGDYRTGEILLLNIDGYAGQAWSFLDSAGKWIAQGLVAFPLRAAYSQVALRERAAYVMAVSDVVEPN